jgi:hypothetical protein
MNHLGGQRPGFRGEVREVHRDEHVDRPGRLHVVDARLEVYDGVREIRGRNPRHLRSGYGCHVDGDGHATEVPVEIGERGNVGEMRCLRPCGKKRRKVTAITRRRAVRMRALASLTLQGAYQAAGGLRGRLRGERLR